MPTRGKSRAGRAGRNKEDNLSPELESVGSTKEPEQAFATELTVSDWRILVEQEESELFIAGIVDEWVEHVLDVWYERYLDRASVPYIWEWYKSNLVELVRLDHLSPEPGEDPLTDPSWVPDPQPVATPIDSWAPAAVPFISDAELKRQEQESLSVLKSQLQFDVSRPLEPLLADSDMRAQLSSALSLRADVKQEPRERDLRLCMDDYSSSDLSIVTATDSCDWWRWAQSRRLDRQPPSQNSSSAEEAARRVADACPEPLQGDADLESAYREYIKWVDLVESDEEDEEEVEEQEPDYVYQAGARVDYVGIDLWSKPKAEPEPEPEPQETPPPATPDTEVSECRSCCAGGGDSPGDAASSPPPPAPAAAVRSPELPAIRQLRALRLSRCSGLLVRSEPSSGSGQRLPAISRDAPPPPAKAKRRAGGGVGRAADPGHYEQVEVDCAVTEPEKQGGKKASTRLQAAGRAARRRPKPPPPGATH